MYAVSCSRYRVVTWSKIFGSRSLDQDLWIKIFGSRSLDQDLWIKIFGSRSLDQGLWIKAFGSRSLDQASAPAQAVKIDRAPVVQLVISKLSDTLGRELKSRYLELMSNKWRTISKESDDAPKQQSHGFYPCLSRDFRISTKNLRFS